MGIFCWLAALLDPAMAIGTTRVIQLWKLHGNDSAQYCGVAVTAHRSYSPSLVCMEVISTADRVHETYQKRVKRPFRVFGVF